MLSRQVARVAGRTLVQRRLQSTATGIPTTGEFRHYDVEEPFKYSKDVTGFSAVGLIVFAIQLQFVMSIGEGEPEFPAVAQIRQVLEA